jgi:hypothetical protein
MLPRLATRQSRRPLRVGACKARAPPRGKKDERFMAKIDKHRGDTWFYS